MIREVKAKVFSGSERGVTEADWFRTVNLFNAGKFINEYRESFGDLFLLNEETLSPGRSITCEAFHHSHILIVPVWGTIKYTGEQHGTFRVHPGDVLLVPACKRHTYSIVNEMETDSVQFIQLGFRAHSDVAELNPLLRSMDPKDYLNRLHPVINQPGLIPFQFFVAQYEGHNKGEYTWNGNGKQVFVYVIQGSLEVEGQLLHAGDALGLRDINEIKWEALSGYAYFVLAAF